MGILHSKIFILIVGSVLVAGGAWYLFLRDATPAPLLQTEDLMTATGTDREVVETLLQLRAITLSGTIFSDPAFTALQDRGTQIVPEPVGRSNPFLPLPFSTSPTSTPAGAGGQ
jgi:hypothetical protein